MFDALAFGNPIIACLAQLLDKGFQNAGFTDTGFARDENKLASSGRCGRQCALQGRQSTIPPHQAVRTDAFGRFVNVTDETKAVLMHGFNVNRLARLIARKPCEFPGCTLSKPSSVTTTFGQTALNSALWLPVRPQNQSGGPVRQKLLVMAIASPLRRKIRIGTVENIRAENHRPLWIGILIHYFGLHAAIFMVVNSQNNAGNSLIMMKLMG